MAYQAVTVARVLPLFVMFLGKEGLQVPAALALTLFCKVIAICFRYIIIG